MHPSTLSPSLPLGLEAMADHIKSYPCKEIRKTTDGMAGEARRDKRTCELCRYSLEAELAAIHEGVILPLNWTELNLVVETDCAEAK